jgi:hypothetical protein
MVELLAGYDPSKDTNKEMLANVVGSNFIFAGVVSFIYLLLGVFIPENSTKLYIFGFIGFFLILMVNIAYKANQVK